MSKLAHRQQGLAGTANYGAGGRAGNGVNPNYKLVGEKIIEWDWFQRFLDQNPDVAERYEVHKTYEILNDTRN
jgi:hypothetical protein